MPTISDIVNSISICIQESFEELVKILIRKNIRPIFSAKKLNTNKISNLERIKNENYCTGSSLSDNVNKYSYSLTNDTLGWSGEYFASFKIVAKIIKNDPIIKSSTNNSFAKEKEQRYICKNKIKTRIAFTEKESEYYTINGKPLPMALYKNFLSLINSKNVNNIIINSSGYIYLSDISYIYSFKDLQNIGEDIIYETDPSINGIDSSRMSTAILRIKLYNLEKILSHLSIVDANIYESYLDMVYLINSMQKNKTIWIVKLIANLTFQRWENLLETQKKSFLGALGENFIDAFNSNNLITILLQSNASELILKSSYLYSLNKMLFAVFGYSKIIPYVSKDECKNIILNNNYHKFIERYNGAIVRRKNSQFDIVSSNNIDIQTSSNINYGNCESLPEPISQCTYDYIKLFEELYPTIVGIMGGSDNFPPENIKIKCNDIPPNYNNLSSIPEYLWRFNDYSYCKYLDYINSKHVYKCLSSKINNKTKELLS